MSNNLNTALLVIAMSGVTIMLRFLPFLVFNKKKEIPTVVIFIGDFLPSAAIGMLVIYGLSDINLNVYPYGLTELIASLVVVLLQVYKRNSIVSILFGTITYMLLLSIV